MKNLIIYILIGLTISGCSNKIPPINDSLSKEKELYKIYPFKSAIVKYTFEGRGTKGTKVLYIDDWGILWAEYISMELGNDDIVKESTIKNGSLIYNVNLDTNTAVKSSEASRKTDEINLNAIANDFENIDQALSWLDQNGIHLLGSENLNGYDCRVVEYKKGVMIRKCWVYNGLTLKSLEFIDKYLIHIHDENFTEIKLNVSIDPNLFELPAGVKIVEDNSL